MVILAKALFKFEGAQADDLSFDEDDIITVTQKDDSGWWTGKTEDGREGDFPFNYVEVMDEASTQKYLKKIQSNEDDSMAFSGDRVDTIELISLDSAPGKGLTLTIETSTKNGAREKVTKTMQEIRKFDSELRGILPDFEGKLPPIWGDKVQITEKTRERRKDAVDVYLQKLVYSDGADFLLIPFLIPGKSVELSQESFHLAARAKEHAKSVKQPTPESFIFARAEYQWDPQDTVELALAVGDVVAVLSKDTGSEGWWEGQVLDGSRGLFPCNHVDLLKDDLVKMFLDGKPLPELSSGGDLSSQGKVGGGSGEKKKGDRPVKVIPNFTLKTLQAFDDIIDKGIAIEAVEGGAGPCPRPGDRVVLKFKAHIWDGQAQAIVEFSASEDKDEGPIDFSVDNDPTVIPGLHLCVQKLMKGSSARIIIAPKLGFGAAGYPPAIPPLAFLIYDIQMTEHHIGGGKPSTPKMKPEVKARAPSIMSSAGQRMSLKLMAPIMNRGGAKPAAADAPIVPAASSVPEMKKVASRAAGHVVLEKTTAGAPSLPVSRVEIKKFDLPTLQQIVKDQKYEEHHIDRRQIEEHLTDAAFFEAFLMDRGQFLLKPQWRQTALKKNLGLF